MSLKRLEFLIAFTFIVIGVFLRLIPHAPNFTPITAIALFGGFYLSKKTALILPILAMFISDFFIGYYGLGLMISVYGSFVLIVFLSFCFKKSKNWYTIGGGLVISAVLFFLITNFCVWVFTPWYTKTIAGFFQCYLMAIPFFRATLASNLFYGAIFFGAYETISLWLKQKVSVFQT
jgi:hypothetical protein